MPKYLILSHHNILRELRVLIFIHFTLYREPIRLQADFPTLIAISRQASSVSQTCKSCWSAVTLDLCKPLLTLSQVAYTYLVKLVTFRVSRRRREVYICHARLCVCLSVRGRMPTLLHGPGCNLGEW